MSATSEVAAFLRERLELRVLSGITTLANLTRATVYVSRATVVPRPPVHREHTVAVWVLAPEVDEVAADRTLDPELDRVLDALDAHPSLTWTTAERTVFGGEDGFHAWRIDASVPTKKE